MTDPQATAQPIEGITTFAIEQAKAREEGRCPAVLAFHGLFELV